MKVWVLLTFDYEDVTDTRVYAKLEDALAAPYVWYEIRTGVYHGESGAGLGDCASLEEVEVIA
jgi:hypothetical protein